MGNQGSSTIDKYRHLCGKHILPLLGERKLPDLKAAEVDRWLASRAESLSTSSLRSLYGCLNRSVRRAMARDLVRRNVVELVSVPTGRRGRPSRSLTPQDVDEVLSRTASDRLHHYIVLSLLTGARTEELRALRWEHVHLDTEFESPIMATWPSPDGPPRGPMGGRTHGGRLSRWSRLPGPPSRRCSLRVRRRWCSAESAHWPSP